MATGPDPDYLLYCLEREQADWRDRPCAAVLPPGVHAVLLGWMTEVHGEYHLRDETLHLAARYLARCLPLTTDVLQAHACAALALASKMEEVFPPLLDDFAALTAGAVSPANIRTLEHVVLCACDHRLLPPTSALFLRYWLAAMDTNDAEAVAPLAHFFNTLSLLVPCRHAQWLPSTVAQTCLALACRCCDAAAAFVADAEIEAALVALLRNDSAAHQGARQAALRCAGMAALPQVPPVPLAQGDASVGDT